MRKPKPRGLVLFLACATLICQPALAAGKKRPNAKKTAPAAQGVMKRAIELDRIQNRYIELPDAEQRLYGENIHSALIEHIYNSKQYVILVGEDGRSAKSAMGLAQARDHDTPPIDDPAEVPDPCLGDFSPIRSSQITIRLEELSFATGSKAERTFYGFTRGNENPYNAGIDLEKKNEFPLRTLQSQPGWFENVFNDSGNLHSGIELGHEINFDVFLVGAKLKKARYDASIGLEVTFRNRFGESIRRQLTAKGHGFYYDVSAHVMYQGMDFLGGLMVARRVALQQAFDRAIKYAVETIGTEVSQLPLMSRVACTKDNAFYISTGADYRVPVGQRFYDLTQLTAGRKPTVFTVDEVFQNVARVKAEGERVNIGDEIVSLKAGEAVPQPTVEAIGRALAALSTAEKRGTDGVFKSVEQTIDTGNADFGIPDILKNLWESSFARLIKGFIELATLPYRIWRYNQYDQKYKGGELWQPSLEQATALAAHWWQLGAIGAVDAWKNCPSGQDCLGSRGVVVAVIDSGVDYNHPELRRNIFWDGERGSPGWDFFSGDPRPYDDHAHGTEVASVIAGGGGRHIGVAPNITLMPVKAFSPYGLTNSAALYSSFEYAIGAGARVIVVGWGTRRYSKALEDAVKVAQANGVLVVAAAGDGGEDLEKHPYFPAVLSSQFSNLITVAGYAKDGALTRAYGLYSNFGKGVDLAAPGADINVANPREQYKKRSHTGLAAGVVAGAAGLIWSRCPGLEPSQVKEILINSSQHLETLRGEVPENRALSLKQAVDKANQVCK